MTLRFGSRERLVIRLSVRPAPRYSTFGSALIFLKGRTATESIVLSDQNERTSAVEIRISPNNARTAGRNHCERICRSFEVPLTVDSELVEGPVALELSIEADGVSS